MNFLPLHNPRLGRSVTVILIVVFAAGCALIIEQCAAGLAGAGGL